MLKSLMYYDEVFSGSPFISGISDSIKQDHQILVKLINVRVCLLGKTSHLFEVIKTSN